MSYQIRPASLADCRQVAEVHVASWRETYREIIADNYLAELSVDNRLKLWQSIISLADPCRFTYVATIADQIVGFVNGGYAREPQHGFAGELNAIYLLKAYQGQGIGKALFETLVSSLIGVGIETMYLWVLKDNLNTKFYQSLGGRFEKERIDQIGGQELAELMYVWQLTS